MFADYKTDKLLMLLVLINMQEIIIIEKKLYFEMWSVTILTVALTDVCSVWKLEFLMNLITALSPQCMGTNGAIWLATGVLLYVLCQNEGFLNNYLLPSWYCNNLLKSFRCQHTACLEDIVLCIYIGSHAARCLNCMIKFSFQMSSGEAKGC